MKVTRFLKKVASKIGLIEMIEENDSASQVGIKTICISLADLQAKYESEYPENKGIFMPELLTDFDTLLESLKIQTPPHGWTVSRVIRLMNSEELKSLKKDAVKQRLLIVLKNENVPVEDILKDAGNRDQALDIFEKIFHDKLFELITSRKQEIMDLEGEVAQCQERIKTIKNSIQHDKNIYENWVQKKINKEQELLDAVSLLTLNKGISVGPVIEVDEEL